MRHVNRRQLDADDGSDQAQINGQLPEDSDVDGTEMKTHTWELHDGAGVLETNNKRSWVCVRCRTRIPYSENDEESAQAMESNVTRENDSVWGEQLRRNCSTVVMEEALR